MPPRFTLRFRCSARYCLRIFFPSFFFCCCTSTVFFFLSLFTRRIKKMCYTAIAIKGHFRVCGFNRPSAPISKIFLESVRLGVISTYLEYWFDIFDRHRVIRVQSFMAKKTKSFEKKLAWGKNLRKFINEELLRCDRTIIYPSRYTRKLKIWKLFLLVIMNEPLFLYAQNTSFPSYFKEKNTRPWDSACNTVGNWKNWIIQRL